MPLTVFRDLPQGSQEWLNLRAGRLTASTIGRLITPTLKVASNDKSRALLTSLAAERITGTSEPMFVTADMERGNEDEPYAREAYEAWAGVAVEEVGFMVEDTIDVGYSPDGLVGTDGLIEIKSRRQARQLSTILTDKVPAENMAQIQCGLLVSGRAWCDYISYRDGMHLYVKRVHPDPEWFAVIYEAAKVANAAIRDTCHTYKSATRNLPYIEKRPDLIDAITF